ncbi:polyprenyl synthetase family protein [Candidatus Bathyarchaeota archaeon]|nr:MAG: polyprenyl synthetase family protein [Candidatus Bathyarchaeota archaeon]
MSPSGLARFIRLGQQADPVILDALSRGAPSEFRPALSYHFEVAGKRMRAAMVVLSCAAAGGRVERAIKPAAVVEMIHNYSLVMDDLIDRGEVRRGRPTVRVVMGDSIALLVAMFYREVLDDLIEDLRANRNVRKVAVKTMKEIIDGERLDLLLEQAGRTDPYLIKNRISNPTFKTYLDMVGKKTASLFKAAGQIGAYAANAETRIVNALGTYGWKAGLAFQVMDDVLDICGEKTGKQQAKDIIEHKLGNAAILIALRFLSRKDREELKKIVGSERVSTQMLKKARSMVNKTPAERECREIAMKYLEDAKASLSVLKPSPFRDALSDLADQVVARSY